MDHWQLTTGSIPVPHRAGAVANRHQMPTDARLTNISRRKQVRRREPDGGPNAASLPVIARRHVFHVGGYDPIAVEARYRRFQRELAIFERTWSVTAVASDLVRAPDNSRAWWTVTTQGRSWRVETTYEVLTWDDIILADFARPMGSRLVNWMKAFLDFTLSGTVFKYFWASWSYGLFFFYPIAQLVLFAGVAFLLGQWLAGQLGFTSSLMAAAIGIPIFLGLFMSLGRRWRVNQALDDWIFAHEFVHGRRGDVDARLDSFAAALIARARDASLDEIVVVGHSLGASLVADFVERALARDPDVGRRGPQVCILSVGATTPKFTLHPAGHELRRKMARVAAEPTMPWAEYQAWHDLIGFCWFDPVSLSRGLARRGNRKPVIRVVAIGDMLRWTTYLRYAFKFMRVHYQFVMANEKRAPYDYFMMVCGPIPFTRMTEAARGPLDLISADGSFSDTASAAVNTERAICNSG